MTELAADLFVCACGGIVVALLLLGFLGLTHGDIAKKCHAHHGVQQIAHSLAWKDETMIVCRDGSVWSGK